MNTLAFRRVLYASVAALALGGCAAMKSHDELATQMRAAEQTGSIPAALKVLEASATSPEEKAALLYNMERGELLRLNRQYRESTDAYLLADQKVNEWEEAAKTDPKKLMGMLGAATISERLKVYEGQDYEKVWLTTRLALNRVAAGDLDTARVDIKRTHEREAVIAEFRSKETAEAEEAAKAKGVKATGKEINGYPTESLDDPEVLSLKNGYQNALSHYLAGFVYEVLNEPGLAAPGYRKAIELKPETPLLEEGLRGLDRRTSYTHKGRQRMTDVLFVVEAGNAPARKSKAFTVPIPTSGGLRTVSISYPVIEPSSDPPLGKLMAGGSEFTLARVVDVNVMARRALRDDMPGMVLRGVTRAIVKSELQWQLQKNAGTVGAVLGIIASVVTEQADDRIWRRLPGRVYLARGYLPEGSHKVAIEGRDLDVSVKVGGQYALVPLRINGATVIAGDVGTFGTLVAQAPQTVPDVNPTADASAPVQKPLPPRAKVVPKKAAVQPALKRKPASTR